MYNVLTTLTPSCFIFAGNEDSHEISNGFEIRLDLTMACGLAAYERLETMPIDILGENVVTTLVPSFLKGSSLSLQVMRTTITTELDVLECLKNQCLHFYSVAVDLILFKSNN